MNQSITVKIAAGCVLFVTATNTSSAQTSYLNESFSGSSAPAWQFVTGQGTGSVLTASEAMPLAERDSIGNGWLRLTRDLMNQSSFVYCTNTFPTVDGLVFSFDFAVWTTEARPAADGFTLAIFDATASPGAGGYGGSLGYAQRTAINGMNKAIVGFGFDSHGNFSSPTEGRVGGPGRRPNSIAFRGPMGATRQTGYGYIMGSAALESFHTQNKTSRGDVVLHSARIAISPEKTVSVAWTDKNGAWQKLIWENVDLQCPESVLIGFTAGTGGSRANQEVRNLKIASYTGTSMVWDGGSAANAGWGSAANWVDDALPGFDTGSDLLFSATDSDQLNNYLGAARVVRSLAFTTNTVGDVVLRTTTTPDGTEAANLIFCAEGDGAAIMVHAGAERNYLVGEGAGALILSNNLLVAHHGTGTLTFGRPVTGLEGITKTGSGTLVFSNSNSYAGETVLMDGTLRLTQGSTLGSSGNNLSVWGGSLNLGGTEQIKQTIQMRGGALSNGTLRVNSRLHYYGGVLNTALTGNGGVDKWEAGVTLTLSEANTYLGTTVVRAGTLLVNNATGSGTGSNTVTVNQNAAIGGHGTIGGNLLLYSGAKFVFSTDSTLHVNGSVTCTLLKISDMLGLAAHVPNGKYRQIQGGVTTNGLDNLGGENAVKLDDDTYAYFTVENNDLYVVVTANPLSAALDMALYAVAGGQIVIEVGTINENGSGDIVVYAWINAGWVEVGRVPAHRIAGTGSHRYQMRTRLLSPENAYQLKVVDEAGRIHESREPMAVRSVQMGEVRLTLQTVNLEFTTEPGYQYVVQSSTNLLDWVTEEVSHIRANGWSEINRKPFSAGPGQRTAVRIPANHRQKIFFRVVMATAAAEINP